jgi:hypothetical protein
VRRGAAPGAAWALAALLGCVLGAASVALHAFPRALDGARAPPPLPSLDHVSLRSAPACCPLSARLLPTFCPLSVCFLSSPAQSGQPRLPTLCASLAPPRPAPRALSLARRAQDNASSHFPRRARHLLLEPLPRRPRGSSTSASWARPAARQRRAPAAQTAPPRAPRALPDARRGAPPRQDTAVAALMLPPTPCSPPTSGAAQGRAGACPPGFACLAPRPPAGLAAYLRTPVLAHGAPDAHGAAEDAAWGAAGAGGAAHFSDPLGAALALSPLVRPLTAPPPAPHPALKRARARSSRGTGRSARPSRAWRR